MTAFAVSFVATGWAAGLPFAATAGLAFAGALLLAAALVA